MRQRRRHAPVRRHEAYRRSLQRFVYTSGTVMQPVFAAASDSQRKRIVYAEGEDDRVLRAAQVVVDEGLRGPILVGRPDVDRGQVRDLGLRLDGRPRRRGGELRRRELLGKRPRLITSIASAVACPAIAPAEMRRNGTLVGAMLVARARPTACCAAPSAPTRRTCAMSSEVIGLREGARGFAAMNLLILPRHTLFICDTYVNLDPSAERSPT